MRTDKKLEQLAGLRLFAGADRKQLDRIAGCCTEVRLSAGQVLCRQGRLAREVIVLDDGHAWVHVDGRQASELLPGDVFGGIAVLTAQPYPATVTASTAVRALTLTCAELRAVLDAAPMLAARMLSTVTVLDRAAVVPVPRDARTDARETTSAST